jgi:leader peptidase (prepilin peptidase)/N-methyltransferase
MVPLMDLKRLPSLLLITPLIRASVAIHAVPVGDPWRRSCDNCGDPLDAFRPSRAFGPSGRCGSCRERIGVPPYLVEAATIAGGTLIGVLVAIGRLTFVESLAVAWWAGWAVPLAFIDASVHRLPDRLTYPAAAGTALLLTLAVGTTGHDVTQLVRALVGGLGTAAVFAALTFALGRLGPGLGDAKLMLSTATLLAWFGWQALSIGIAVGIVTQGVLASAVLVARRANPITHISMGPFLIGGAAVAIAIVS